MMRLMLLRMFVLVAVCFSLFSLVGVNCDPVVIDTIGEGEAEGEAEAESESESESEGEGEPPFPFIYDFTGSWLNETADSEDLVYLTIAYEGFLNLSIEAGGYCGGVLCDWGTSTHSYRGSPITGEFELSDRRIDLTIDLTTKSDMTASANVVFKPSSDNDFTANYDLVPGVPPTGEGEGEGEVGLSDVTVNVLDPVISLWVCDAEEDSDRIRVTVNDSVVVSNLTLVAAKTNLTLDLQEGGNQVTITALSEGTVSTNAGCITISDVTSGLPKQSWDIPMNFSESFVVTVELPVEGS
ncbi:hypothetical protein ACFL1X_02515 [Candidatus Hydrogenedentota bacterium]